MRVREPSSAPAGSADPALRRELPAAGVLVLFGLFVVAAARRIPLGVATDPLGTRFFPTALGAGIALCGVLLIVGAALVRGRLHRIAIPGEAGEEAEDLGAVSLWRLAAAVALTAGYLALFEPLGYLLATPLYVLAIMLLNGGAPRRSLIATPVLVTAVLYAVFRYGLLIPLPDGILEPLLRGGP